MIQRVIGKLKQIWSVRGARYSLIAVAGMFALIIIVQLLWPSSRTRPFLVVSSIPVGAATKSQVVSKLSSVNQTAKLNLILQEKTYNATFLDTGVTVNSPATADSALKYPIWHRLIPLSLFGNLMHHPNLLVVVDEQNIMQQSKDWSADAYNPPTNASLEINGTTPAVVPAKDGYYFKPEDIVSAIKKMPVKTGTQQVKVKSIPISPLRSDNDVKDLLAKTKSAIEAPLILSVLDKTVTVPNETKASWITFTESTDKKNLTFAIKPETLQKYLEPLQKEVYIKPSTTVVTVVDGAETARTLGAKGRGLKVDETIAAISAQLQKPSDKPLALVVGELQPNVTYNRSFSKSSQGLTALLATIGKAKGDYAITVQELSGRGFYGSYNGNKQYHPASTYKLFVAYSVLKRIDNGSWAWGNDFKNGSTVEQCFSAMIVRSDNACAEAFGDNIGWATINSEIRAIGITNTNMLGGQKSSSTNDQVKFLNKLLYNDIVSADSKNRLLSAMKSQIYRAGVPKGVSGAVVADKVGFLDGLLHDTAIVYSSHGTYLISIYTNGSTWASIADTARQIEAYLASP